jgi:flagellin-like protein
VTTLILIKKKKAVSPVIAVVLMIAVAVAITITVYAWTSGFVSSKASHESANAETMVLESVHLSGTNLTVNIRSKVPFTIVMDTVYINGSLQANGTNKIINPRTVTTWNLPGNYQVGDNVKLVTDRGTQMIFVIKST